MHEIKRTFNDEYLQATVKLNRVANKERLNQSIENVKGKIANLVEKSVKENKKVAIWGSGGKGIVALAVSNVQDNI